MPTLHICEVEFVWGDFFLFIVCGIGFRLLIILISLITPNAIKNIMMNGANTKNQEMDLYPFLHNHAKKYVHIKVTIK